MQIQFIPLQSAEFFQQFFDSLALADAFARLFLVCGLDLRRFEHLFTSENPGAEDDLLSALNPNSKTVIEAAKIEPILASDPVGAQVQFERLGYFSVDPETTADLPVFNEIVPLRDTWKKIQKSQS